MMRRLSTPLQISPMSAHQYHRHRHPPELPLLLLLLLSPSTAFRYNSSNNNSKSMFGQKPPAGIMTSNASSSSSSSRGGDDKNYVPDRLRDAFAFYGADAYKAEEAAASASGDGSGDIPYRSPEQRSAMMQGLMGMNSHTISMNEIDKVRNALDDVRRKDPSHADWGHLNSLLQNCDMCLELVAEPGIDHPVPGDKCWVHLEETKVRRKPYVLHFRECGNSFTVLPVFSQEEYMTHYFQRMKVNTSCWFPHPKMGSQRKEFEKLKFPVCAHGPLAKLCALAISMTPKADETFLMCINPFQQSTKFITYPEMVRLAKKAQQSGGGESSTSDEMEQKKKLGRFGSSGGGNNKIGGEQQQQDTASFTERMLQQRDSVQRQQAKFFGMVEKQDAASSDIKNKNKNKQHKKSATATATTSGQKDDASPAAAAAAADFEITPPKTGTADANPAAQQLSNFYKPLNDDRDLVTRQTLQKIKHQRNFTSSDGSTAPDILFSKIFNTEFWVGRRISVDEAIEHARGQIPFPEIDELQEHVERTNIPSFGKTVSQEEEEELQRQIKEEKERAITSGHKIGGSSAAASDSVLAQFPMLSKHMQRRDSELYRRRQAEARQKRRSEAEEHRLKCGDYLIMDKPDEKQQQEQQQDQQERLSWWTFPVAVTVPQHMRSSPAALRAQQQRLPPFVRVPRIALDELMLLMFDLPYVKLIAAQFVLRGGGVGDDGEEQQQEEQQQQLCVRFSIVSADPVALITQLQQDESTSSTTSAACDEAALRITSEIESNAADAQTRLELNWSFPKVKSNIPFPVLIDNITTSEWQKRRRRRRQEQEAQENASPTTANNDNNNNKSKDDGGGGDRDCISILFDRLARNTEDLEQARVMSARVVREELDYDGGDIEGAAMGHKKDWGHWH